MAKRNSTKVATQEQLSASEPRIVTFQKWAGINISEVPSGWKYNTDEFSDGILKNTYLTVQDNVMTTSSGSLQTRDIEKKLCTITNGTLTGVNHLHGKWLYIGYKYNNQYGVLMFNTSYNNKTIDVSKASTDTSIYKYVNAKTSAGSNRLFPSGYTVTDVYVYQRTLIIMASTSSRGWMFRSTKDIDESGTLTVTKPELVSTPTTKPTVEGVGLKWAASVSAWNSKYTSDKDGYSTRLSFGYAFVNDVGMTNILASNNWGQVYVGTQPAAMSTEEYVKITVPQSVVDKAVATGATAVYIYYKMDESLTAGYAGSAKLTSGSNAVVKWYGGMYDTAELASVSTSPPDENTSQGVDACYVRMHDSRLYFWGGSKKYRLSIGGNVSNELSISRGHGGAYVDIQPGSGTVVNGTAKFKTYQGANIVTIMCGHANTNMVKRFNLIEDMVTITTDNQVKSFSTEEVSNVVGCQSRNGFKVCVDGLYSIDRYGLMVTTQALESNNQLRSIPVSEAIQPVFTDIEGNDVTKTSLIHVDQKLYIHINSTDSDTHREMIFVYDTQTKAWYTYTHNTSSKIITLFNFDNSTREEGVGYITSQEIGYIPTTGNLVAVKSESNRFFIETGELSARLPPTQTTYVQQLDVRFDWIVGKVTVVLDGIDYYGRKCHIVRTLDTGTTLRKQVSIPMRIELYMECHKLRIYGTASFRLTHINEKLYTTSNKIGSVYGYMDSSTYKNHHGTSGTIHHTVAGYNDYIDYTGQDFKGNVRVQVP